MTATYTHFASGLVIVNGQVTGAAQSAASHFEGATHGFNGTQWVPLPPKDGGFPVGGLAGTAGQAAAPAPAPETLGPYQVYRRWSGWALRCPTNGYTLSAGQARQALEFSGVIDVVLTPDEIRRLDKLVAENRPGDDEDDRRRRRRRR